MGALSVLRICRVHGTAAGDDDDDNHDDSVGYGDDDFDNHSDCDDCDGYDCDCDGDSVWCWCCSSAMLKDRLYYAVILYNVKKSQ